MLDSYGKPSGGILKGALHYVGSFDECNAVHAYIPRNDSLFFGQHAHDHDTEFDTRFCRVTFNLPESLTGSFGVVSIRLLYRCLGRFVGAHPDMNKVLTGR